MHSYQDLIEQTFDFPNEEFHIEDGNLFFNNIDLVGLIKKYGTPLKLTYLPKISNQIRRARHYFSEAFEKNDYQGKYLYSYCTKSSHFEFVLNEALKNDIHLETSSAFDLEIINRLREKKAFEDGAYILCNGFKRPAYTQNICKLINSGYENCIPILDNLKEIDSYEKGVKKHASLGIRIASDESPGFEFYTSRLGVRYKDVISLYNNKIKDNPKFTLKLLHFFINTGIRDTSYYWNELNKFLEQYCELRKVCPDLKYIDIGGGLPIKTSLLFEFQFQELIDQIIENISSVCHAHGVPEPDIFTEFGTHTVGESGAVLYSILDQKLQNDKELWYMIDGSFITNLPDTWAINQRYILLSVNNWHKEYRRVNLGGLTCDSQDYYNSEAHTSEVFMPAVKSGAAQYIGFFHTGAYQESIGGYGGIQHCLIPAPKHVILSKDENGKIVDRLFREEQKQEDMLNILGY